MSISHRFYEINIKDGCRIVYKAQATLYGSVVTQTNEKRKIQKGTSMATDSGSEDDSNNNQQPIHDMKQSKLQQLWDKMHKLKSKKPEFKNENERLQYELNML